MADSTLVMVYSDYVVEVADIRGWGRGPTYTATQTARLETVVRSGVRQFYFPPPMEPGGASYCWSFLRPVATMLLPVGKNTVQMPDDFGGIDGTVTVNGAGAGTSGTGIVPWPVKIYNAGYVLEFFARSPTAQGQPIMASLQPIKGTTAVAGQRQQMVFYPLADQNYTIQFQYYVMPDALTGANPYVYGGAAHSETVLESCLAIAEQRLDDAPGLHTAKWLERLAASIGIDRKNKPEVGGYNGDNSDAGYGDRPWRYTATPATLNGQSLG